MRESMAITRHGVADTLANGAAWATAAAVVGVFGWIGFDLVVGGLGQIDWGFLTRPVERSGRSGGIGPVLVSTGLILMVCLAVSIPLGLGTAVLLAEYSRRALGGGRAPRYQHQWPAVVYQ